MSAKSELLRNRKILSNLQESNGSEAAAKPKTVNDSAQSQLNQVVGLREPNKATYHLTRIVLLRFLGFVYSVAFLIAFNQNRFLLGKNGLKPVNKYLRQVQTKVFPNIKRDSYQDFGLASKLFLKTPTLLWFVNWTDDIDTWLDLTSFTGLLISAVITITGCANSIQMFILWILYHTIVNVGQTWYSFGWESQLLEIGFVAIFLVPLFSLRKLNFNSPPSFTAIYAYRWLVFRLMLGAGLIKLRGDKCWTDLTCMNYHYETQPVPNPMAYYMHQEPEYFHKFEVMVNHFVELIGPFFIVIPYFRKLTIFGGILQIIFQATIIVSGNLSFLNWLTILPCLACFDDNFLQFLFSKKPSSTLWCLLKHQYQQSSEQISETKWSLRRRFRRAINFTFILLIGYLSVPVLENLISPTQVMNTSFEPFRLVNTYGAFGSITKERNEIIFKGTTSTNLTDPNIVWKEYEFHCKPGNVHRRPCLISPYHFRLDWLMWFAAFQSYEYHPWLFSLSAKFLLNDKVFLKRMLSHNPFEGDNAPPKYITADLYSYKFTKIGTDSAASKWWTRKKLRNYMPIMNYKQIEAYVKDIWPHKY